MHAEKPDKIKVYVAAKDSTSLYYNLKSLKRALPKIIVKVCHFNINVAKWEGKKKIL